MKDRYDVVIVGGGHNGLVATAYLARAGLRVLLLERSTQWGGATQSQRLFPDYDAQLSRYAYLISLLPQKIVDDLQLEFRVLPRRVASFTVHQPAGRPPAALLMHGQDQAISRDSMIELTGGDQDWKGWQRFQCLSEQLARLVWPTLLEPLASRDHFQQQLGSGDLRSAWEAFVDRPLGETIEACITHDAVRGLVMTDGKIGVFTNPHDPTLLQNRCFLYHVVGGGNGRWSVPVGGMGSLVQSLRGQCTRAGAEMHSGAEVIAVEPDDAGEHTVCYLQDQQERAVVARHVLVTAGPKARASMLGRDWTPTAEHEGSVAKVNVLLARLPRLAVGKVSSAEAFTGSFHLDEGYDAMQDSYRQASAGEIPDRPPVEMYCHTLTDPSILGGELAARGFHTLTLFGLDLPYRLFDTEHSLDAARETVWQRYLAALDRICAEPFMDCIARDAEGHPCVEIKLPQDLECELGLDQGNIFHNAPSWFYADGDYRPGEWGVETDLPRVYLAGSSAHRGGAVSGIPGHNAAMRVLADLGRS